MYVSGEKTKFIYSVIVKKTGALIIADLRPKRGLITYAKTGRKVSKRAVFRCIEAVAAYEVIKDRNSNFISRAMSYNPSAADNDRVALGVFIKKERLAGKPAVLISPLGLRDDWNLYSIQEEHNHIMRDYSKEPYLGNLESDGDNMEALRLIRRFKWVYNDSTVVFYPVPWARCGISEVFLNRLFPEIQADDSALDEIQAAGNFAPLIKEIMANTESHPEAPVLTCLIKAAFNAPEVVLSCR